MERAVAHPIRGYPMKPTMRSARAVLKAVYDGEIAWTHKQGYQWLKSEFLPSLDHAEQEIRDDELLSTCLYVLGDVHHFNGAPLAAIDAYRRALEWQQFGAAYREIGGMLETMGRFDEASDNLQIAVDMDPDDDHAKTDLEFVKKSIDDGDTDFLFKEGDKIWECNELLARADITEGLRVVEELEGIEANKARARCFGAMEDTGRYLTKWRRLGTEGTFGLDYGDWWFMPESIYDGVEIWKILRAVNARIAGGTFPYFDSLLGNQRISKLSSEAYRDLMITYFIAANSADEIQLTKLVTDYPEWDEAKEALAELKAGR